MAPGVPSVPSPPSGSSEHPCEANPAVLGAKCWCRDSPPCRRRVPSCQGCRAAGCPAAAGCAASPSWSRSGGASCGRSAPPRSSSPSSRWQTRRSSASPGEESPAPWSNTPARSGLQPHLPVLHPSARGCPPLGQREPPAEPRRFPAGCEVQNHAATVPQTLSPWHRGAEQHHGCRRAPTGSPAQPTQPPAPRQGPCLGSQPVGHAAGAPPQHAARGHHLLLRRRLGSGRHDAHCRTEKHQAEHPWGWGAGSQPRAVLGKSWRPLCRHFPMARAGLGSLLEQDLQGQHRTFVESRLLLCLLLLPARWSFGGGSGGRCSLRLLLALLEARLGLRGQKRSPVSHDPARQPHSAWEHTHTVPRGGHMAPDMLLGHTDAGQAAHQHTQSVLLQRGHGLGGLCSSWPGTPQCPGDTAPCWKSFLQGDGPDTAWRGHPGAPGWRCPVLSSCPCLQEGTGSHEGRSWGRHWAAAGSEPRAVFGVLSLLHPEHTLVTLTLSSIIIPSSAQLLFLQPYTHAS